MNQAVLTLTGNLLSRLPANQKHYSLADLEDAGIPELIRRQIRIQITINIRDQIRMPDTEWAALNTPEVRDNWFRFLSSLETHAQIPVKKLPEIIEHAVSGLVSFMSRPRQRLPEIIFGKEPRLLQQEVDERCDRIVVYGYFTMFIREYMKRKKLEQIKVAQFNEAIAKFDDRLTRSYTPYEWAKLLQPAFELFENQVPARFFADFFLDKGQKYYSEKFAGSEFLLNKEKFIETLSHSGALGLFDSLPVTDETEPVAEQEENEDVTLADNPETEAATFDEGPVDEAQMDEVITDPSEEETGAPLEPEPDETPPLKPSQLSMVDLSDNEEAPEEEMPSEEILDNDIFQQEETVPDPEPEFEEVEAFEDDPGFISTIPDDSRNEEQLPMWKSFSRQDDSSVDEQTEPEEAEETPEEEPEETLASGLKFKEEDEEEGDGLPFFRIKQFDDAEPDDSYTVLNQQLKDAKKEYVKALFSGDESAYEFALQQLAGFNTWREAGKYLTNEIFRRNTIDMYNDTAVDFTDRLHKFFINRDRR